MTVSPPQSNFTLSSADRRGDKRFAVARPGKVFRRSTQQYAPAVTRNLSLGGALIEADAERPFACGELVDLAVAFGDGPVLPSSSLLRAIVVRVSPSKDGRQSVALRYIAPSAMPLPHAAAA